MSVVPEIRAAMPVPEPPPVTWRVVPGFFFMYSSAQRWPRMTMVSEPLTVMVSARTAAGASSSKPTNRVLSRMFPFSFFLELGLQLQGEDVVVLLVLAGRRRALLGQVLVDGAGLEV